MKNQITLDATLQKQIIDAFERRATQFNYSKKKKVELQHEFLLGACMLIDILQSESNNNKTCLPANWYVAIIRGELATALETNPNLSSTN